MAPVKGIKGHNKNPYFFHESSPGVIPMMDLSQPFPIDVCIDLGSGNIRVAQHHLHRRDIGTPLQEVSRKGVAQGMRGHSFLNPRPLGIDAEDSPEALSREWAASGP